MKKPRIHLVSWDKANKDSRISALTSAGFEVVFGVPSDRSFFQSVEREAPSAIVIDLERSPSQGRDIAVTFRTRAASRSIPIVFVGGKEITSIRKLLPDATYTTWDDAARDIQAAITHPVENPVVPSSVFAAYSGVPLAKKLGIKTGSSVLLLQPPSAIEKILLPLPEGVSLCQGESGDCDILLWFIRSRSELDGGITAIAARSDFKSLWMIWPKKTSRLASDLTQQIIREAGLSHKLVDYKISSLDDTWTGLCFVRRKNGSVKNNRSQKQLVFFVDVVL